MEIERIYARKEYLGNKVGQILIEKSIEIAKQKKMDYIWLGVWRENPRAISFYSKNGFTEFGTHPFMMGNVEQTDILMKWKL